MLSSERLGNFTGSSWYKLLTGGQGVTRKNYILEKAIESILGHEKPSFSNMHTEHGEENEYEAIRVFSEVTGLNVKYLDQQYFKVNDWLGSTPDAAVVDFSETIKASMDAKCPTVTYYMQKLDIIENSKPEFQNCTKQMFYQGQIQMMSLSAYNKLLGHPPVTEHYLFRYLTKPVDMQFASTIEYDMPIEDRYFFRKVTADPVIQEKILVESEKAKNERDELIVKLKQPIN